MAYEQLAVTSRGFAYDRRWMLIDSAGRKLTQRETATMAFLTAKVEDDKLILLDRRDGAICRVGSDASGPAVSVDIWETLCETVLVSPAADAWLSARLGQSVRLVHQPDTAFRPVDPRYARTSQEEVSLADGYPFLLANENSLADLQARSGMALDMRRFRPNIVISGPADAWAEDQWRDIQIGDLRFRGTKPCARCQVITINPDTAEKGQEPMRTLATYRRDGNKVLFGLNMVPETMGMISVGAEITVQ